MPGTTIVRDGRQHILLAAVAVDALTLLGDLDAVTHLLGDLIDQRRSSAGPPRTWAVAPIGFGPLTLRVTLLPDVVRDAHTVQVRAVSTDDSTVAVQLRLRMVVTPADGAGASGARSRLETAWSLRMVVPVPRLALLGTGPALDRTVGHVVADINARVAATLGAP